MLNVEEWARTKNPVFAYHVISIAIAARDRCEALHHIKVRRVYGQEFKLPDFPSWFALYRSPLKAIRAYTRLFSFASDSEKEDIAIYSGFRYLNKASAKSPNELKSITITQEKIKATIDHWQEKLTNLFGEINKEIAGNPVDPEVKKTFQAQMAKDELLLGFYFLVYAPSLLFYEVPPQSLYKRALKGDLDALEMLLKLDPLLLHDHAIGYQIQSVRLYGKRNAYEKLLQSINKYPTTSHSNIRAARKSVKSHYGGLIAIMAKVCQVKFPVSEVRHLYDSLARTYGKGQDQDIGSPEGFDKTVKNKMLLWQNKLQISENQK